MANKVPKEMMQHFDVISGMIAEFCKEYLNDDYREICEKALAKLCRKRPSPLLKGRAGTWAAGIVHAIATANFLFDKSNEHYISVGDIAERFGIAKSTVGSKSAEIRKMLRINYFNSEWMVRSAVDSNSMVWMVTMDGLPVDARMLPLELQIICHENGLIPYVPALQKEQP